jgi:DUF2934 family protein
MNGLEDKIRQRAYELWEESGGENASAMRNRSGCSRHPSGNLRSWRPTRSPKASSSMIANGRNVAINVH